MIEIDCDRNACQGALGKEIVNIQNSGRSVVNDKDYPLQMRHKDLTYHRGKNRRYFVILIRSQERTISAVPEIRNCVFFPEEEEVTFCKVIKTEELMLSGACIFFGYRNEEQAGGGLKQYHSSLSHP